MEKWLQVSDEDKVQVYNEIATQTGLTPSAVEKDWWVTQAIALIFKTDLAPHLVFKGGTSLSKAWGLIERFSEDIDLAVDRSFFGIKGPMNGTQVRNLRKLSSEYITTNFYPALKQQFEAEGFNVDVKLEPVKSSDQDPLIIEIYYPNVIVYPGYIQPRVLVEIGSRSLREPLTIRKFASFVGSIYPDRPFADSPIDIPTVNPERTLLEKIFLLHEEFQKPIESVRVERLSRHLYDIDRLIQTASGAEILQNENLYKEIVNHRRTITPIRGIDYNFHKPEFINPIPPVGVIEAWQKDYTIMQEQMIHGESVPFEKMIENITAFRAKLNQLGWNLD
jgi:hypothetical protein